MARNKGSALVVAGSSINGTEQAVADDYDVVNAEEEGDNKERRQDDSKVHGSLINEISKPETSATTQGKRRLSKADRRRLKKNGGSSRPEAASDDNVRKSITAHKKGNDFRDPTFFIENDAVTDPEAAQRRRQVEAAMQPSAANNGKGAIGAAQKGRH